MAVKPGPGWTKSSDGHFYAHPFTFADFPGAHAVAVVFLSLSIILLGAGALAAFEAAELFTVTGLTTATSLQSWLASAQEPSSRRRLWRSSVTYFSC